MPAYHSFNEAQTRYSLIDPQLTKRDWNECDCRSVSLKVPIGGYNASPANGITDECHRSIYNKFSDILAYFDAIQIGLTVTPAHFIDRNTFRFLETDGAAPTYLYPYDDAVKEGYLADYQVYAAQTRFQRKGIKGVDLSEEQEALRERGIDPETIN